MGNSSESNARTQQFWELANDSDGYAWRGAEQVQQWSYPDSLEQIPYQQDFYSPYQPNFYSEPQLPSHSPSFQNPYPNYQSYSPENDSNFFHQPDSFPNFQTPFYDNDYPHFQPHAQSQTEHGYYPQPYPMEFQQQEHQVNDPQPPILSEDAATFAAILEALKPNSEWFLKREEEEKEFNSVMHKTGFPWKNSEEAMEDNRGKAEKEFTLVDTQEWSLEVEERKFGAEGEQFREKEELEPEEMEGGAESSPSLSLHTEQKWPLQSERGMNYGVTQDSELKKEKEGEVGDPYLHLAVLELPFPAALQQQEEEEQDRKLKEAELSPLLLPKEEKAIELQPALNIFNEQQAEKESEKKKLELVHCTLLEGVEEAPMKELTCEDLAIPVQEEQNLWQHGSSIQGKGEEEENLQISPPSLQLLRIKGNSVEDFTSAELDFPLHDGSSINDGQHLTKGEEQEEGRRITPDLLKYEASELQLPQATTPRRKEAAVYPSRFNNFSFDFELTLNQFLVSLMLFISGVKLQEQQLLLTRFCKLQAIALSGDVHKKGTHGDGVPWYIKVHPP